jgi:hypothetical protein
MFSDFLPEASAAALAASERPSLSTAGTTVAAARTAAPRNSPLWVGFWCPDPRPRWDGGSWPENQSGGGGTDLGGEVGGCPIVATFFLAGAGACTSDSSLVLLLASWPSSPPLTRSAISFLAATLLAFWRSGGLRRQPRCSS